MIETISAFVTALGVPFAIFVFWKQRQRERENEEIAIYESITSDYNDFLRLLTRHSDLRLWSKPSTGPLTEEQEERLMILFDLLVSLFERAWLLSWSPKMTKAEARRWAAWDNYMREWIEREDFAAHLPELLQASDPDFVAYVNRLAGEVAGKRAGQGLGPRLT
ncbi:MAG: hypothetical protein Q4G36_13095 [Paracoccus sp. (in: a-proteobacteria)]|nr:hypothetical protein [Paracoccus sp. (in: a-proteobacteria)]